MDEIEQDRLHGVITISFLFYFIYCVGARMFGTPVYSHFFFFTLHQPKFFLNLPTLATLWFESFVRW